MLKRKKERKEEKKRKEDWFRLPSVKRLSWKLCERLRRYDTIENYSSHHTDLQRLEKGGGGGCRMNLGDFTFYSRPRPLLGSSHPKPLMHVLCGAPVSADHTTKQANKKKLKHEIVFQKKKKKKRKEKKRKKERKGEKKKKKDEGEKTWKVLHRVAL